MPKITRVFSILFFVVLLGVSGCARAPMKTPVPPAAIQQTAGSLNISVPVTHRVEHGQTLYRIAKKYGVDVNDLMRANHIHNVALLKTGQTLVIPGQYILSQSAAAPPLEAGMSMAQVARLAGPKRYGSDWRTITVHHSATGNGGARAFHRDHLRRRMGGLFYHFVIGNGTHTRDGEIEAGWRWKKQVKANRPYDIQICLVGNFSKEEVSRAQFGSLVRLVGLLQDQYGISTRNVRRHEDVKGKNTECPGKHFPFHKLLNQLSRTRR